MSPTGAIHFAGDTSSSSRELGQIAESGRLQDRPAAVYCASETVQCEELVNEKLGSTRKDIPGWVETATAAAVSTENRRRTSL